MITIDPQSATPPYEQIRLQIAGQVADRTLPVGAKLPTVRALAADLGLAVNTVARAYRELEEAGIITTRGRSGSFVSPGGQRTLAQAHEAAADYARLAARLGFGPDEALRIVEAAIRAG
jgi:DNA-binding transcriptional regulator YhcF (GntR family)